jgi:aminopeptidase N
MVGWKTYHDQWLSEGLAEFSAALYLRKTEPKNLRAFWDLKRDRLLPSNSAGHRPVDVGPLWLGAQLPAHLEEGLYQQLVYFKGAYVMEMLRAMMWDPRQKDSDARFIAMMHDFVASYAARNASTEDFRRVVEKHMGEPMDWFFDEWIYGTEVPSYNFKYQLKDAADGKTTLSFTATQSGVSEKFRMRVPLFVWVNNQPRRLGQVELKGNKPVTVEANLPFKPDKVTLDEEHSILCHSRD